MRTLRQFIRTLSVIVLIPLTLFGGRPVAGCLCADGHFSPACSGHQDCNRAAEHRSQLGGCPRCRRASHADNGKLKKACCRHAASSPRRQTQLGSTTPSCCRPLNLSPMTTAAKVQFEVFEHVDMLSTVENDLCRLERGQICWFPGPSIDTGPPRERLNVLQRFLI